MFCEYFIEKVFNRNEKWQRIELKAYCKQIKRSYYKLLNILIYLFNNETNAHGKRKNQKIKMNTNNFIIILFFLYLYHDLFIVNTHIKIRHVIKPPYR